ncbi:MAG: helix-turn-helix transcriptional regulator [Tepidisphaeraceae bacterium]
MLGDTIKRARLAAGLTQEALAAAAGLSREYVNYLERGKRQPTVEVFLRLCRGMKVHPSDLLERLVPRTAAGGTKSSTSRKR